MPSNSDCVSDLQFPCRVSLQHLRCDLHQEATRHSLQQQGRGIGVQPWQQCGLEVGALNVHQTCAACAGKGECQVGMVRLLPICLHWREMWDTLQGNVLLL